MSTATAVAQRFYRALADTDGKALFDLLTDDFVGIVSTGMPHGVGGEHHGRVAMITDVWGRIDVGLRHRRRPVEYLRRRRPTASWFSAVTGARRGTATQPSTPRSHTSSPRGERITALQQITDTVRWRLAAPERRTPRAVPIELVPMSRPAPPALTVRYDGSPRTFAAGNDVVVGRDLRADVRIAHPLISRAHLVLRFDQGRWIAIDNGSLNGMFLNGRRVPAADIPTASRSTSATPTGRC